jgi:hypothetical protein
MAITYSDTWHMHYPGNVVCPNLFVEVVDDEGYIWEGIASCFNWEWRIDGGNILRYRFEYNKHVEVLKKFAGAGRLLTK